MSNKGFLKRKHCKNKNNNLAHRECRNALRGATKIDATNNVNSNGTMFVLWNGIYYEIKKCKGIWIKYDIMPRLLHRFDL